MKYLEKLDIYSPSLNFNLENNSNIKASYGGILTLLTAIASMFFIVYLGLNFLEGKSMTITKNEEKGKDLIIKNFLEVPFMISAQYHNGSEGYNRIWARYKYYIANSTHPNEPKILMPDILFETSRCDINNPKHFNPKYRHYFESVSEFETYFCADYGDEMYDMYGTYGNEEIQSYITFYVSECSNKTSKIPCKSKEQINSYNEKINFKYRTLSSEINHYNKIVDKLNVVGDKFSFSNQFVYEFYLYIKNVDYIDDVGIFYQETQSKQFFQAMPLLKNIISLKPNESKYFAQIYITNHPDKDIYKRSYMKIQGFFAGLAGLINGMYWATYAAYYLIGNKILSIYLYNNVPNYRYNISKKDGIQKKHNMFNNAIGNTISENFVISQISPIKKNNILVNSIKNDSIQNNNFVSSIHDNSNIGIVNKTGKISNEFNFDSSIKNNTKIKPSIGLLVNCCNKDLNRKLSLIKNQINNDLNLVNIVNRLYQHDKVQEYVLNDAQLKILDFIYCEDEISSTYNKCCKKEVSSNISKLIEEANIPKDLEYTKQYFNLLLKNILI